MTQLSHAAHLHRLHVFEAAPVEQKAPSGQDSHCSLVPSPDALLKLPSLHGSAADAPAAQYEPATHLKHAVWPLPPWNLPASHLSHSPMLVLGCTVPGLHSVATSEPVEQNEPAGQPMQSSSLVIDRLSAAIVPFW